MARRRTRPGDPAGVLVIDKPSGPTSHDIVALVRRALRMRRVGHTGTLDPLASGVLVICVGEATKLSAYLTESEKGYRCTVRLGQATDTHDATGRVVAEAPVEVEEAAVQEALGHFRGQVTQIPPMYSAIKKGGERLYELARQGKTVEREPRVIHIRSLEMTRFEPPELDLRLVCSKGTYVRTLAHDLGEALGTYGHLESLVRTQVGHFTLEQAVSVEALEAIDSREARDAFLAEHLVPMAEAVAFLPALHLDLKTVRGVRQGRKLQPGELARAGGGGLRPGQLAR
ncbi:MAG: tRNA pseudouridine(55) synthase TruB, partial [Deltaproteobacteria bacterium]